MSWFDRVRVGLALSSLVALSGCFQPMYSEAAHPGIAQAMKSVDVAPITGRLGYYLTDDLVTQINGTGETPTPKYRLQISVPDKLVTMTPTVESQIAFASSATIVVDATFVLTEISSNKVVSHGQASATAAYDRSFDSYANLRASRDAELRVSRSLAEEIAGRVGAAISSTM